MRQSIKSRLEQLEAAHRPPGPAWTIGAAWTRGGRVVATTPPRLLEPGEGFSWQRCIDEMTQAHAGLDDADDWGEDLIAEDEDDDATNP